MIGLQALHPVVVISKKVNGHTVEVVGRLIVRVSDNSRPRSAAKVKHTFDFKVDIPHKLQKIMIPIFDRICKDTDCNHREPAEWANRIKKHIKSTDYRTWVASIAWWDYGKGRTNNEWFEMCEPLPPDFEGSDDELANALRAVGYPDPVDRVNQLMGETRRQVNAALAKLKPIKIKIKK